MHQASRERERERSLLSEGNGVTTALNEAKAQISELQNTVRDLRAQCERVASAKSIADGTAAQSGHELASLQRQLDNTVLEGKTKIINLEATVDNLRTEGLAQRARHNAEKQQLLDEVADLKSQLSVQSAAPPAGGPVPTGSAGDADGTRRQENILPEAPTADANMKEILAEVDD